MEFQPLTYIYLPAATPNANTLLLLHGTGGDENDLVPIGKQFGDNLNILSIRGNVMEHGMPRFFKRLGMGIFDEQDLNFRTEELYSFLQQVSITEGFDSTKIIALGYSNGANIAGSLLVTYPDFLSGAILFRPMQPFKLLPTFANATNTPLFMSSGKSDPTVEPDDTAKYVKALTNGGFKVSNCDLNTSHNLTQEDLSLAKSWFNQNF